MVEVFWSGGFDSTFMVLSYLKRGIDVSAYYLLLGRPSQATELSVIGKVRSAVSSYGALAGRIVSFSAVPVDSLPRFGQYYDAWRKGDRKGYGIALQTAYLSCFAERHKGIAYGKRKTVGPSDRLADLLHDKGHIRLDGNNVGYLTRSDCDPLLFKLFGNFSFPLYCISEKMMSEMVEEWGLSDIMKNVHFCYSPIDGEPCGLCGPCRDKLKDRMYGLFSEDGLMRGSCFTYLYDRGLKTEDNILLSTLFACYVRDRELFDDYFGSSLLRVGDGSVDFVLKKKLGKYFSYFRDLCLSYPDLFGYGER